MVSFEVHKQPLRCIQGILCFVAAIVLIWLATNSPEQSRDEICIVKAILSGKDETPSSK